MNSLANPIIPASENIVLKKKPNFTPPTKDLLV